MTDVSQIPPQLAIDIAPTINRWVSWVVTEHGEQLSAWAAPLLATVLRVEDLLRSVPWWVGVVAVFSAGWWRKRSWVAAGGLGLLLALVALMNLWTQAMQSLALMLVALAITVVVALPLGILSARSRIMRAAFKPILDACQTLPTFVYLVPAMLLFGLGKVPAVLATVIAAVPPLIRLTDHGLRHVNRDSVEASLSIGASEWTTLWRIEIPLALPTIYTGVNQATMMALSMVVLASMIGARGLGEEVLLGIQRLDVGRALAGGMAIVILAIVIERLVVVDGKKKREKKRTMSEAQP